MSQGNTTQNKTAILLVNLGSPATSKTSDVRAFLKQFLWDKRVVNLPRSLWWIILHTVVLPFRPKKSAKAYQKIWRKKGSPLVVLTRSLAKKMSARLSKHAILVDYAMRYGEPNIKSKLAEFKAQNVDEIIILPLYPQYSSTTTASVYDVIVAYFNQEWYVPKLHFISDYHQHPAYINAIADSVRRAWKKQAKNELLLLSFHGLPEKLSEWGDPYYEQCLKTAALIAENLNLEQQQWQCVFQSRFGKAEWLKPYCVTTLEELPQQGIKNIDIICPCFAVDCLETLEEIAITNKDIFLNAGGKSYHYIPALNDSRQHIDALLAIMKQSS